MWEISLADQTLTFLLSLLGGGVLCLLYDLFRIFRLSRNTSSLGMFVEDVLYFVLCGFLTFCFFIVRCSGEIRGYVLLGELLGFLVCRCTLSAVLLCIAKYVYRFFKKLFGLLFRPLRALCRFLRKKADPMTAALGKLPKFAGQTAKKLLKAPRSLVYNHSDKKTRRRRESQETAQAPSE